MDLYFVLQKPTKTTINELRPADRLHLTDLGVLVKVLENLPTPGLVLVVLGEPVQVEETLHCLWSQEVVSICKLSQIM